MMAPEQHLIVSYVKTTSLGTSIVANVLVLDYCSVHWCIHDMTYSVLGYKYNCEVLTPSEDFHHKQTIFSICI